jgi:DNA helicase-2/ATP-dependent DNA helicase PcrA
MATGNTEDIEEERRLLYVAMTRAKDQLMLLIPQRFYVHNQARRGDKHLYAARTRFIPGGIVGHFEARSWLASREGSQPGVPRTTATIDIGARMRQMWRGTGT